MAKLYAIGEALIDFIPVQKGIELKNVTGFEPQVGGAPANVACCVAKLGGQSAMLTQLGTDAFGDAVIDVLNKTGVDTSHIARTSQANTALAFVSLTESGERDFAFYRHPSADMLMTKAAVEHITFTHEDIVHFCSVDLIPCEMKETHTYVIEQMHQAGGTVIFDPNLRFPLWESKDALYKTVHEFIPKAHIIKISDEELEFITRSSEPDALMSLFTGKVEVIIYTEGKKGASIYTKNGKIAAHAGYQVSVEDTTGAGDAFIGAIIYQLQQHTVEHLKQHAESYLKMANAVGAITTTSKGAISSLPNNKQVKEMMGGENNG